MPRDNDSFTDIDRLDTRRDTTDYSRESFTPPIEHEREHEREYERPSDPGGIRASR